MNKHERAKRLIGTEIEDYKRSIVYIDGKPVVGPSVKALTYALKILEAVEGVEEWMPKWLHDADTQEACDAIPEIIRADQKRWTDVDRRIGMVLQAILDAKGGGDEHN